MSIYAVWGPPHSGKTTLAIDMSFSFSQRGQSVLLISTELFSELSANLNVQIKKEKSLAAVWQLKYARMFNRIYDNSKMLAATGLKQENFLSLYDGLKHERETILAED